MVLGTIISNEETPSTHEFCFVLNPEQLVSTGQLVKVKTNTGEIVAIVKKIMRRNRYYEFAESISQYAKEEKSFDSSFPAKDWEYATAMCSILGVYNPLNGHLNRCSFPPSPGDGVEETDAERTGKVLGISKDGLLLGSLLSAPLECRLDLSRLLQKHLAVLGMSGSGKSHLMSVIIEELLNREAGKGRLAVIVLDPHGDYAGFLNPANSFASSTSVVNCEKVQLATTHLSAYLLSELVPSISAPAKREYAKLFAKVKNTCETEGRPLTIDELISNAEGGKDRTNLVDILCEVKELNLFGVFDSPGLNIVKPGKLVVFDLSGVSLKVKQVIASFYARKLFHMRQKGAVPPFTLIVEEAHLFAREKATRENAISKPIIETIAREGRKFGASLCLVSQRPVQLSTTALSQCNSFIVMRVTNPYDLQHIGESCEGIDKATLDSITTLRTGEGIIIGEATNFPTFIKVRQRSFKTAGSPKLEELAKEFENRTVQLKEKDVDAFL